MDLLIGLCGLVYDSRWGMDFSSCLGASPLLLLSPMHSCGFTRGTVRSQGLVRLRHLLHCEPLVVVPVETCTHAIVALIVINAIDLLIDQQRRFINALPIDRHWHRWNICRLHPSVLDL